MRYHSTVRRVAVLLALSACGYPEYGFVTGDHDDASMIDATIDSSPRVDSSTDLGTGDGTALDAPDTLVADAGGDTLVADTSKIDTSTGDTSVADAAEVSIGCDGTTAFFCEDWDKSPTFKAGFDWTNLDPTAALALETSGRSPPNALVADIAPGDAAVVTADLGKAFGVPSTDTVLRADVWLKLEKVTFPTTTGGSFLFKVERGGSGSVGDGVTFSIDDSGFYVDRIGVTYGFYPIAYMPAANTWVHVRMDVKIHTSTGFIKLWIDDMVTPRLNVSGIPTAKADVTTRNFIIGLYAQSATGAFRARYDDVSIGIAPP
jgi:hypothetical protein